MIAPKASSLDSLVRMRLREWPERPPGYPIGEGSRGCWFRGRPSPANESNDPYLKLVGSDRLRTYPDGFWLRFGGTPVEMFVDIFVVEACGSTTNLLDKRSRFAPSTHSMMAVCPVRWLLGFRAPSATKTPRWRKMGLYDEPDAPLILPVRDMRVLYALKRDQYLRFAASQVPHPHEYFCPMDALTEPGAANDPSMRALVSRAATSANFLAPVRALPGASVAA